MGSMTITINKIYLGLKLFAIKTVSLVDVNRRGRT